MRIELATLEDFRDDNQVKSLAFAIAIKAKYTNSIVYNWSYVRLAAIFGIDRRTAKKYITNLRKHDLVEESGKDLKVKKLYNPMKYHVGINIAHLQNRSIIEISNFLYFILMKQNARTQRKAYKVKRELQTVNQIRSLKRFKELSRASKKFGLDIRDFTSPDNELAQQYKHLPNYKISLTMLHICDLFNVSIHKAYKILKFLYNEGMLKVKQNMRFIKKVYDKQETKFYTLHPNYFITRNKSLYSIKANQYSVRGINM